MTFDYSELKAFSKQVSEGIAKTDSFKREAGNRLSDAMLREVTERTPVGKYDGTVFYATPGGKLAVFEGGQDGRVGGTLKGNWQSRVRVATNIFAYISNMTEYGVYVENGHRLVNGGWVEGQFFMKESVDFVFQQVESIVGPIYDRFLREVGF